MYLTSLQPGQRQIKIFVKVVHHDFHANLVVENGLYGFRISGAGFSHNSVQKIHSTALKRFVHEFVDVRVVEIEHLAFMCSNFAKPVHVELSNEAGHVVGFENLLLVRQVLVLKLFVVEYDGTAGGAPRYRAALAAVDDVP